MNVSINNLEKSRKEIKVEMEFAELKPFIEKAAKQLSREIKIDGFRPGNIPYEILKKKIGEMSILEEAARLAINATLHEALKKNLDTEAVGQPRVDITKLAPENPFEYKVETAVLPEITLGQYKNLQIKLEKAVVGEDELKRAMSEIREMRTKEAIVDRPVRDGDKALLDIRMFLDNVPLEGGQSRDAAIIIGKNYVVPGFDKHIIGMAKNDSREFSLSYPKDHHMNNIAGKMVYFKVTAKEVYERIMPELDDEFAKNFGLKSLEELRNNVEKSILDHKTNEAGAKAERDMLEKIVSKAKFGDLAEILIHSEGEKMMAELEQQVADQGGKFDDYLQSIRKTRNELVLDLLPDAVKRVKTSLVIREIAEQEKIETPSEEVDKQLAGLKEFLKKSGGRDKKAEEFRNHADSPEYRSYVYNVLNSRRVVDRLREWNILSQS